MRNLTIMGFTYSADKGGSFYEKPDTWPDLEVSEILSVRPSGKLPTLWGRVKPAL